MKKTASDSEATIEASAPYHVLLPTDIPTWGEAHRKILCESCRTLDAAESDCYYISNAWPGVPMYNYGAPYGTIYNNWLIATYFELLLNDVKVQNVGGAREFVLKVVDYLKRTCVSPHQGMDVWPINAHLGGLALSDGMTQATLALNFLRLSEYLSDDPQSSVWFNWSKRAGLAFEWSWDKGGVAHRFTNEQVWYIGAGPNDLPIAPRFALNVHNKAIVPMDALYAATTPPPVPNPDPLQLRPLNKAWKDRVVRGINALIDPTSPVRIDKHHYINEEGKHWSYHRINADGSPNFPANASYHNLNISTSKRVLARGAKYGFTNQQLEPLVRIIKLWEPTFVWPAT